MTLNFPNESRSYDGTRNVIRFWGYDRALEIAFLVDVSALCEADLFAAGAEANREAVSLKAFDAARDEIRDAARRAYAPGDNGPYLLGTKNFRD